MLATRTLYAVFDPVVGLLVDRSGSRWGVVYGVTLLIVAAVGGARNDGFGIAAAAMGGAIVSLMRRSSRAGNGQTSMARNPRGSAAGRA